jgi:hypothetical protein
MKVRFAKNIMMNPAAIGMAAYSLTFSAKICDEKVVPIFAICREMISFYHPTNPIVPVIIYSAHTETMLVLQEQVR